MRKVICLPLVFALAGCFSAGDVVDLIAACSDLTLEEVQAQNGISDDCREAIESLLPGAENNFSSKLIPLGSEIDSSTNEPVLYLYGVDGSGGALTEADFQGGTITVIRGGTETRLQPSEFSLTTLQDISEMVASISVVTDYSASMRDEDLDTAALIYTDLFNILPEIYEAEVFAFSETVTRQQVFTSDRDTVLAAVARDDSLVRSYTALYDGMGTALTDLTGRSQPIRLLIVATDGLENASVDFSKEAVTGTISGNRIAVIMLGSLFSDVDELEELAGPYGIFFYAPTYTAVRSAVAGYLQSLQSAVKITVDDAYQDADSIRVEVEGLSAEFSF